MEATLQFGNWIKKRRQTLDLTQEALAEAVSCAPDTIRKIEQGRRRPSRQMAELLADCLRIPPGERADFVHWARGLSDAPAVNALAQEEVTPEPATAPVVPALTFPPRPSSSLPLPPTPLVGRERDLAHVKSLLWRSTNRLVTLLGPPGVGKTRLAIGVASALQADFRDGLVYIPLGPVTDPALVAATLADGLGVRETSTRSLHDNLQDALREKQILLILDNFEHVAPAAPLVNALLSSAPQLKILVTSRSALHLRGEKLVEVPPLDLADPEHLPPVDQLEEIGSIALFVERVRDARGDFELTPENAHVVAAICARSDGLPLAIELAAAKTRLLSLSALLSRMEQQLALLTGGPRDAPLHQQTLRGSILSSYLLLDVDEQQLFRRLGVFAGAFDFAAAEGVAETTLDGLEMVLDQSLLRHDAPMGKQGVGEEEARFVMLTSMREFALEQLAAMGELETISRRHTSYFLNLAERARPALHGGPEQQFWVAKLLAAQDDLRAALSWTIERGEREIAVRLAGALWRFWSFQGSLSEGRQWLQRALQDSDDVLPTYRGLALHGAGALAHFQGDLPEAERLLTQSLEIRRLLGDKADLAGTLNNLGIVAQLQGDYERAMSLYMQAAELRRELGDKIGMASSLNNAAMTASILGDTKQARSLVEQSLDLHREEKDMRGVTVALNNLGAISFAQKDYESAQRYTRESLALCREVGDKIGTAFALGIGGEAAYRLGEYSHAEAQIAEAVTLFQELGDRYNLAEVLEWLALVAGSTGRTRRVARLHGAATTLRAATGAPMDPASVQEYNEKIEAARAQMGEDAWNAATSVGAAMSLEEVGSYVRQSDVTEV